MKVVALLINDENAAVDFLKKNTFSQYGVPETLVSDKGTHFLNKKKGRFNKKLQCPSLGRNNISSSNQWVRGSL